MTMSTPKTRNIDMQSRANPLAYFAPVQIGIIALVALGHLSTLALGPNEPEALRHFGYDPSWLGVNVLFIMAGYMALRSLRRHESGWKLLKSRFWGIFPYLAAFTLLVILVVYPLLGQPADSPLELMRHLGLYATEVMSCYDPGRPLPGLLEGANYDCVIQGAIWTFRWGVIAFIGSAALQHLGLLKTRVSVLTLAVMAVSAYTLMHAAQVFNWASIPEVIMPGARLGAMFLMGMALFDYRERLVTWGMTAAIFAATLAQFYLITWTPFIEIFASVFWALVAFNLMRGSRGKSAPKWTGYAAALYIFHWPIGQLLLLGMPNISSWQLIGLGLVVSVLFCAALVWVFNRLTARGLKIASQTA